MRPDIFSAATLQISKIDQFDPVQPGGPMVYQIAVTNTGPSAAKNVVVIDTLPAGVSFQSASIGCSSDGSATGGVVTCSRATLAVGATVIYEITVFAPLDVTSGTVLTNTATADAINSLPVTDDEQTTVQQSFEQPADLHHQQEWPGGGGCQRPSHLHHRHHQQRPGHGHGRGSEGCPAQGHESGRCGHDPGPLLPVALRRPLPVRPHPGE